MTSIVRSQYFCEDVGKEGHFPPFRKLIIKACEVIGPNGIHMRVIWYWLPCCIGGYHFDGERSSPNIRHGRWRCIPHGHNFCVGSGAVNASAFHGLGPGVCRHNGSTFSEHRSRKCRIYMTAHRYREEHTRIPQKIISYMTASLVSIATRGFSGHPSHVDVQLSNYLETSPRFLKGLRSCQLLYSELAFWLIIYIYIYI